MPGSNPRDYRPALGFGLDLVFKRVPAALLKEARARSFPIFAVPLPVPFRDVISIVNRALASSDLRALQRLSSMQLYLMDALARTTPRVRSSSASRPSWTRRCC